MPSIDELKPFLVLGFALGGVFAMSGVGLVVLYRATGVLNLAYGAIGATGALICLVADRQRPSGRIGSHTSRASPSAVSSRWRTDGSSGRRSRRVTRW